MSSPPRLGGMTTKNLTPHTLNIHLPDGSVLDIAPSGVVARVATITMDGGTIDGIPIEVTSMGEVEGLSDPQPDTYFITSQIVAAACTHRPDIPGR